MTSPDAVRAMLGARSVAVVGASARPGSFGERLVDRGAPQSLGARGDAGQPAVRRRGRTALRRRRCADLADPVDLVLLGVNDTAVEEQLQPGGRAGRPVGGGVRLGVVATGAGPVAAAARDRRGRRCGHGAVRRWLHGLRPRRRRAARHRLPRARATCRPGRSRWSRTRGSVFSALLRTRRRIGWASAVSSGQELVTHDRRLPGVRAATSPTPGWSGWCSRRCAPPTGCARRWPGGRAGRPGRAAHRRRHAGARRRWSTPTPARSPDRTRRGRRCSTAYGVLRFADLDELVDSLELFAVGRRARRARAGHRARHRARLRRRAGAGRRHRRPRWACRSRRSRRPPRAGWTSLLDPGLEPSNPLDVWGTGADTEDLFADCAGRAGRRPRRWQRSRWPSTWSRSTTATTRSRGPCSTPLGAHRQAGRGADQPGQRGGPGLGRPAAGRRGPGARGHRSGLRALGHLLAGRPAGCRRCRRGRRRRAGTGGWPGWAPARWTRWSPSRCCATTASPRSTSGPRARADEAVAAADAGRLPGGAQDRRAGGAQDRRRRRARSGCRTGRRWQRRTTTWRRGSARGSCCAARQAPGVEVALGHRPATRCSGRLVVVGRGRHCWSSWWPTAPSPCRRWTERRATLLVDRLRLRPAARRLPRLDRRRRRRPRRRGGGARPARRRARRPRSRPSTSTRSSSAPPARVRRPRRRRPGPPTRDAGPLSRTRRHGRSAGRVGAPLVRSASAPARERPARAQSPLGGRRWSGEGEGDGVGGEAAAAVLVEAVQAEVGDVDDVGRAGERRGRRRPGRRRAPTSSRGRRRRRRPCPSIDPVGADAPGRGSAGGRG